MASQPEEVPTFSTKWAVGYALRDVNLNIKTSSLPFNSGTNVLKKIHCVIRPKRLCAIIGASGCGKSTLLTLLAGRCRKSEYTGDLLIFDDEGRRWPNINELNKSSIASIRLVPSVDSYFPQINAKRLLELSCSLSCQSVSQKRNVTRRVTSILQDFDLTESSETTLSDASFRSGASTGERRRIGIANEICSVPQGELACLLLDEPTTGLDTATAYNMIKQLRKLLDSQSVGTIVATLHQPSPAIFDLVDDLIVLSAGYVVYSGPAQEVISYMKLYPCISNLSVDEELPKAEAVFDLLPIGDLNEINEQASRLADDFRNCPLGRIIDVDLHNHFNAPLSLQQRKRGFKVFNQCARQLYLLFLVLLKCFWRMRMAHLVLPLMSLAEGIILGFLFRDSFEWEGKGPADNLVSEDWWDSSMPAMIHHLADPQSDTPFDQWLQKGTRHDPEHPDVMWELLNWPEMHAWAHRSFQCIHEWYGAGWNQEPDGQFNLNYTYPQHYFLQQERDYDWTNSVARWVQSLPRSELESDDEREKILKDSQVDYDSNFWHLTPRWANSQLVTVMQLVDLLYLKFDYYDDYFKDCEDLKVTTLWYVCLETRGLVRRLEPLFTCIGLSAIRFPIGREGNSLQISSAEASAADRDVLNSLLEVPEFLKILRPQVEAFAEAEKLVRKQADSETLNQDGPQRAVFHEKTVQSQEETESLRGKYSSEAAERRKLFLTYDPEWDFFRVFEGLFNLFGVPQVYDAMMSGVSATVNAMSLVVCLFFLGAAIGFAAIDVIYYSFAFRVTANRDIANKHYWKFSYFHAFALAQIPGMILQALLIGWPFALIAKVPSEFHWQIVGITLLTLFAMSGVSTFVAASTPTLDAAVRLMPVILVCLILFSGFFIREADIPEWLAVWAIYLSPYRWAIFAYSLVIYPPGASQGVMPNEWVLGVNGVTDQNLGLVCAVLVVQAVGYRILSFGLFHCISSRVGTR